MALKFIRSSHGVCDGVDFPAFFQSSTNAGKMPKAKRPLFTEAVFAAHQLERSSQFPQRSSFMIELPSRRH